MTLPNPFPDIDTSDDFNPAIRLFGNRLISEQTILEYTSEFWQLCLAKKILREKRQTDRCPR
ncbi:hypothetical protein [Syntrophomonas palmitatica]|uniref:hypothetical protein n=1 Tax=Syntrophomonas palmitatica TaxID=402877 RepID=UPI001A9A2E5E|nr:hypothetical protein [Syntrophomonas palmitatica]